MSAVRGIPERPLRVLHILAYGNRAGTELSTAQLAHAQAAQGLAPGVVILYGGGPVEGVLEGAGIPVRRVGAEPGRSHEAWGRLIRIIRTLGPDILHAHDLRWWSAVLGRLTHAGPSLLTIHHQMVVDTAAWRWRAKYRIARRTFDAFAAVSRATLDSVCERVPLPRERCVVIPNGLATEQWLPRRSREEAKRFYGLDPGSPLVGFVGRLSPEKGPDDFLRTCRELGAREPRARYWVLGDGEEAGRLAALAERLGVASRVTFWGSRADVAEMMTALDVLLVTSQRETFGLVMLEAMAAGVPIAGFVPIGGALEVVQVPEIARLIPDRDPARLAETVLELLRDAELRDRMTAAGRARVRQRFEVTRVADEYRRLYETLLAARGAPRATLDQAVREDECETGS